MRIRVDLLIAFCVFCIISLCSCDKTIVLENSTEMFFTDANTFLHGTKSDQKEKTNEVIKDTKESEKKINVFFDKYQIGTGYSEFDFFFENNVIDEKYSEEKDLALTTEEFVEVENKYCEIWKKELQLTINELLKVLSDEERVRFDQCQKEWEEYVTSQFSFDQYFVVNSTNCGSSFRWLFISEHRRVFRERVGEIKYMHYLLESKNLSSLQKDTFVSLTILTEKKPQSGDSSVS